MAYFVDHLLSCFKEYRIGRVVKMYTVNKMRVNLQTFGVLEPIYRYYSLTAFLNMLEVNDLTFWDSIVAENTIQTEL